MIESYLRANNMFIDYNEPQHEKVYSSSLQLALDEVEPCISGPKRLHDRVPLKEMKADWESCLNNKVGFKGFAVPKEAQDKVAKFSFHGQPAELKHGSVVIAAITITPNVMLGAALVAKKACQLGLEVRAALVAKKACQLGLEVKPWVKTILASGSRVVTKYLEQSGMQKYLNQQGFDIVGYCCTTCIGNSGNLQKVQHVVVIMGISLTLYLLCLFGACLHYIQKVSRDEERMFQLNLSHPSLLEVGVPTDQISWVEWI